MPLDPHTAPANDPILPGAGRMIEVVRTYLELSRPDALRGAEFPDAEPVRVTRRDPCGVGEYRALYDAVGRAHRWRDRLAWSDAELGAWLRRPEVAVWVLERAVADGWTAAGYHELVRHPAGDVEIVYFGLTADAQGRGLGRALLTHAVRTAWTMQATRVWLHTCTLDGPAALPNYLARGFRIVREERYLAAADG